MAKDLDLNLNLDGGGGVTTGPDLKLQLDTPNINTLLDERFPARRAIRDYQPSIEQRNAAVLKKDLERGVGLSAPTEAQASTSGFRKLIRAIPGESRFERSLERDLYDPVARVASFFFPSEQDYYREAAEEDSKRTPDEIVIRGQELMLKDGLTPSTPGRAGGPIFSPLDTVGPTGVVARLRAGGNKAVRKVVKKLSGLKAGDTIADILRREVPGISPQRLQTAVENVVRESDEVVLARLVNTLKRDTAQELFEQAPRRFTPSNLPKTTADEVTVFFNRTNGPVQNVALDYDTARRFGDNIEIGVLPRNRVRLTGLANRDADGVRLINRLDADEVVFNNRSISPELREKLRQNIVDEADVQRYIRDEVLPSSKATPEQVLRRKPAEQRTIVGREDRLLRDKLQQAQSISRRAAVATRAQVKSIQNDLVRLVGDLPLQERGKFIATIKNIQTPEQLRKNFPDIQRRVTTAIEKVQAQRQQKALRKQVRQIINQKRLRNTESLRKALGMPSLRNMTVDDLRTFARILAPYQPGDRFLSQRILETIDRTSLVGSKTYREVQQKLAKEAGVPISDLQKIQVSWMDKFRYDTSLARRNAFYDVVVKKINGSLIQGNIRFAQFEDELDDLLVAARKSRKGTVSRLIPDLVPTDEAIVRYIESPNKDELVNELTPEELQAANYLIDRYAEARDYLIKEQVLNKYVKDYTTHIRRSSLEAWKQDGLLAAAKEMFEQYKIDQANFNILNEKTGDILPLEKFFAFAQQRTGNLKPSQNIGRAAKAYFQSYERKRALDSIVPELQAYSQSVTPTRKTAEGLDYDPSIKNFLKEYINTKRGRPRTVLFAPGSAPDVMLRSVTATTRLIDLGLSIPNFAAANVGEQASSFIQQGTKKYATGIARMNTSQGKKILEKYRGFVGRSPWQEIRDTSKNFPDKMMTMMLSGFHDASVRANKQGLLGALTKEEYMSGEISPERLAVIRNDIGRWRALDNSASIIGSTGEGKIFTQYKSWAVPIISSTLENLSQVMRSTSRLENPLTTRAGQELMRETIVVGTVALAIYNYFEQEDETFVGQMINKSLRDAMSAVGALDPEMWLQTPRAWQYLQDVQAALQSLVLLEQYKSGEEAGTLKGDDALRRLVTPAPLRQLQNAAEAVTEESPTSADVGIDLDLNFDGGDIGDIDLGLDL